MHPRQWILAGAVVAGSIYGMRDCLSKAPDEKLAGQLEQMCSIARGNVETPERGVRKLGAYLTDHLGDITGEFADTITTIEAIRDDDAHDARARVARDRLRAPYQKCSRDWERFGDAITNDPAAIELIGRANVRLGRTLEILLGDRAKAWDLRDLSHAFDRAIDRLR